MTRAADVWLCRNGALCAGLTSQCDYMQTCIKYSVWLIFMIYRMNEDKFDHIKAKHARIALARKTRAQRAVAA